MILYIDGKKQDEQSLATAADTVSSAKGQMFLIADVAKNRTEFEQFDIPEHLLEEFQSARSGHMESRDGYDYIILREPSPSDPEEKRKILVFFRKNLLIFAFEDSAQLGEMAAHMEKKLDMSDLSFLLSRFFERLTHNDTRTLQSVEENIIDLEEQVTEGDSSIDRNRDIGAIRRRLLYYKSYYEQLLDIISDTMENENRFLSKAASQYLKVLADKLDRIYHSVLTLQDFLTQVREEYQTQIDISLNSTMKVFTVITAVCLPLTLLVGWYGMNVDIPEYKWNYGYLFVIGLSIFITVIALYIFKKKKWF